MDSSWLGFLRLHALVGANLYLRGKYELGYINVFNPTGLNRITAIVVMIISEGI